MNGSGGLVDPHRKNLATPRQKINAGGPVRRVSAPQSACLRPLGRLDRAGTGLAPNAPATGCVAAEMYQFIVGLCRWGVSPRSESIRWLQVP